NLAPPERAFIAGYLCHLVTDEQWMLAIYRPVFGRRSPYGGSPEGAELQWGLHTLLEQRLLEPVQTAGAGAIHLGSETAQRGATDEQPAIHRLVDLLAASRDRPLRADVLPFLPLRLLAAWRDNVLGQAALAPGAA